MAVGGLLMSISLINAILASELGVLLSFQIFYSSSILALGLIYLFALLLSLAPAIQAYRVSRSASRGSSLD
jgi:hypothetical protein